MKNWRFRKLATYVAGCHLTFCGIWGTVVLFLEFGNAFSDSYEPAPWWLALIDTVFQIAEAPVVVTLHLFYHPSARFEPPAFYLFDLAFGSNVFTAIGLCLLWSVGFGGIVAYAICRARSKHA